MGGGMGGGTGYPNRFIHHPVLKQSREAEAIQMKATSVTNVVESIPTNDIHHFPALGSTTTSTSTSTNTKLNFKEMVMRNSTLSSTAESNVSTVVAASSSAEPAASVHYSVPSYQKTLSSSNIFLAAFQSHCGNEDADEYNDNNKCENDDILTSTPASSVLIDSCDKKYDRLYR